MNRNAPAVNRSKLTLTVDGRTVEASPGRSIIEAIWEAGQTRVQGIGCLGQGVCGSCRVMVRRAESDQVDTLLACETVIEEGMQVTFLSDLEPPRDHPYQLEQFTDSWQALTQVAEVFPEASHCRHCGGCDTACPRGIEVQSAVEMAVEGRVIEAAGLFETCVMCDLCSHACPELISPNHLGLSLRRLSASLMSRPSNLLKRLRELELGQLQVNMEDM